MTAMGARWVVTEDADMIGLRVDLWNGFAVHVLAWKDDAAPHFVALTITAISHRQDSPRMKRRFGWQTRLRLQYHSVVA